MEKRGQITVFIVIGIILLLSTAMVLYVREKTSKITPATVPEEIRPIKQYIGSCIRTISEEAIITQGLQAGFLHIPKRRFPRGSYLEYIKNSDAILPYWYFLGRDVSPVRLSMEEEISTEVNAKLKDCLENFTIFKDKFNINETKVKTAERFEISKKGELATKTEITDNNVIISVIYPLEIKNKKTGKTTKIDAFRIIHQARVGRVYRLAKKVFDAENKQLFLENLTIDLMTMNPAIPFTGIEFRCKRMKWSKSKIAKEIQDTLYVNTPDIRIKETKYRPFQYPEEYYLGFANKKIIPISDERIEHEPVPSPGPDDLYEFFNMFYDAGAEEPEMKVNFRYQPEWGINLEARPSAGDDMVARSGRGSLKYLRFLCLNFYHFTYDLIYPIEITVTDQKSFGGRGYTLRYAVPVLINHNQGDRSNFGISYYLYPIYDKGFCDEKNEEEFTIYTKKARTFMPIKDVNLTFRCLQYYCGLGSSEPLFTEQTYGLKTRLPKACVFGGEILADKSGYLTGHARIKEKNYVEVMLTPLKRINFTVKKYNYYALSGKIESVPLDIEKDEMVNIHITPLKKYKTYDLLKMYELNQTNATMDLILDDVTYKIEANLLRNEQPIGGYINNWSVKYEDLDKANNLTINVIQQIPIPISDKDKMSLIKLLETDKIYKEKLIPELK